MKMMIKWHSDFERRTAHLANSSSPGGIFKSKHRITWFAFKPELSAMTPAMSILFIVRSRCNNEVDSGRNSARAIAPAVVIDVDDRNNRFNAPLRVKAVRSDWILNLFSHTLSESQVYTYTFQTGP